MALHKTLTPDEHVWTSPENAMEIVKEITKVLAEPGSGTEADL